MWYTIWFQKIVQADDIFICYVYCNFWKKIIVYDKKKTEKWTYDKKNQEEKNKKWNKKNFRKEIKILKR